MKLIGEGLQYRAYDMGGGRVMKMETSHYRKFLTLLRWYFPSRQLLAIPREIRDSIAITRSSIAWLKQHQHKIPQQYLGNLTFLRGNDYEQDKVQLLSEYFALHTLEEDRAMIEQYADLVLSCWESGFSDMTFNYTRNAGVDDAGRVVLIDVGEISHKKEGIAKIVADQKWLTQSSYVLFTPEPLQPVVREIFAAKLTVQELEKRFPN